MCRLPRRLPRSLLAFSCFLASFSLAQAATPRDEVLRYVPGDVGFCLVVQDLRDHSAAFLASDFVRHFQTSALGLALSKDPELQKLIDFQKLLEKQLGLEWAQVRDDLLGDALVFAYRPGPPGKPEQEQGLILVRARDAKLLSDFLDRLDKVQKKSGELKEVQTLEHRGRKYVRRVETKGDNYYYLNGSVLVLSSQEAMLKQALDRDLDLPATEAPPLVKQFQRLGAEKPLAVLWMNPQAFTPEIEAKAAQAEAAEAAILKNFLGYWKALEGVAFSVSLQKDLQLTLTVRARTEQLPPAARKLLAEASKPSELWDSFPEDALLAAAGRLDVAALLELLDDFLTKETRLALHDFLDRNLGAVLGKNALKEVFPHLGPDVGLCITAPPAQAKEWFPHSVLALRVRPGDRSAPVDQSLLSAINSYAMLAVVAHNRQNKDQLILKSTQLDKLDVKYLVNDKAFPPGLQPAFALDKGYLVLGSSPEAIRRFSTARRHAPRGNEVPLLRMSLKDLRQYLSDRRDPIVTASAVANQVPREEAQRNLDGLLSVLQLVDRLELSHRSSEGTFHLTLHVQPVKPLRK